MILTSFKLFFLECFSASLKRHEGGFEADASREAEILRFGITKLLSPMTNYWVKITHGRTGLSFEYLVHLPPFFSTTKSLRIWIDLREFPIGGCVATCLATPTHRDDATGRTCWSIDIAHCPLHIEPIAQCASVVRVSFRQTFMGDFHQDSSRAVGFNNWWLASTNVGRQASRFTIG